MRVRPRRGSSAHPSRSHRPRVRELRVGGEPRIGIGFTGEQRYSALGVMVGAPSIALTKRRRAQTRLPLCEEGLARSFELVFGDARSSRKRLKEHLV